jgi:hypothetical protein
MGQIHPANGKLQEAHFFLMLMHKHSDRYEFKYFLSAFLSAVSSCAEHNKLYSSDARFKDWYRHIIDTIFSPSVLPRLATLRNKEVHHKGTPTFQHVGFARPDDDPIETTKLEITMDFSSGKPVGTIQTAEMDKPETVELTNDWVWDVEGSPKVFQLCEEGLSVLGHIIQLRDEMKFQD